MPGAYETEQMQLVYESAERCKRCKEIACKQPSYVEVVYCPRFVPLEPYITAPRKSVKKRGKQKSIEANL